MTEQSTASPLKDRVILVTGASRGLGGAVAEAAGHAGAQIVATARTRGALEALDDRLRATGGAATLLPLDLLGENTIEPFGASIYKRFGRLDAVIHAAGDLGPLTPTQQLTTKNFRRVLDLHATAALRLIASCDTLLRAAPAGQAVFIDDPITRSPKPYWAGYRAAKAALRAIVESYAEETRQTAITVTLFEPAIMQTRLRRAAFPGEPDYAHPPPDAEAARLIEQLALAWSQENSAASN